MGTLSRCENILNDIKLTQARLILMDWWIPDIVGEKTITFAKQHEAANSISILLFSANANIEQIADK